MSKNEEGELSAAEHEIEVVRLTKLVEGHLPLEYSRACLFRPATQCPAVLKEACKRLRKRHPELKVKRVKECGESFIRVSPKKD